MISNISHSVSQFSSLPEAWRAQIVAGIAGDESLQAWLETDLDTGLRYSKGLVVLTDRRLLALQAGEPTWQEWPFRPGLSLGHHDHAGVGTLELRDEA